MDQVTTAVEPAPVSGGVPALEMQGISKTFPGVKALNDVQLRAYGGEVLALMGENGAGKSTLMKILSGAYQADPGGQILIEWQAGQYHRSDCGAGATASPSSTRSWRLRRT